MANRSPKPSSYNNYYGYGTPSPGGAGSGNSNESPRSRLLSVSGLQFGNLQSLFTNLKEEEGGGRVGGSTTSQRRNSTQRELVQAILQDQEQWEKLHQAMKQQRSCTSMGLTQNLRMLLQDRVSEMEASGTYYNNTTGGGNRNRINTC